jgi:hypothetical protein
MATFHVELVSPEELLLSGRQAGFGALRTRRGKRQLSTFAREVRLPLLKLWTAKCLSENCSSSPRLDFI